jgi:hypothetical protein
VIKFHGAENIEPVVSPTKLPNEAAGLAYSRCANGAAATKETRSESVNFIVKYLKRVWTDFDVD